MRVLELTDVGTGYTHQFPDSSQTFPHWAEYRVSTDSGPKTFRLAFGTHRVYGADRSHVIVFHGGLSIAEFTGTDDHEATGDLLSEVKVRSGQSLTMCRYPNDPTPDRYAGFPFVGMPTRIAGGQNAWSVLVNIGDHSTICSLAALRLVEKS